MRAIVVSDLHCEFYEDGGESLIRGIDAGDAEVAIVAGDLCDYVRLEASVGLLADHFDIPVVYTFGNHECYGASIGKVRETLQKLERRHGKFHVLDNSHAYIRGRRFIGATLWFDHYPEPIDGLSDFRCIEGLSDEVKVENERSRRYLAENMRSGDVVVSHHLPSVGSVSERWRGSRLNRVFVCEMDGAILDCGPATWVHGHTHDPCDYRVGSTRVLCNPSGYPGRGVDFKREIFHV